MFTRIILAALLTVTLTLFSVPVGRSEAETAAKNWLNGRTGTKNYISVSEYINYSDAVHIFSFKDGGFVIIAADDASIPVLGYSFTGEFGDGAEKSNISFWLGLYKTAIEEIRTKNLDNSGTSAVWKDILENRISKFEGKAVEPLLTSTWNQSPIYNMYCPLDGGSLSVVGCVATAMSQIMYYHKYPATGKSFSSYSTLDQNLAVNYYLSKYNWDLMPNALSSSSSVTEKHEVAQISYHAGVSVEMMYGADGSGAYSEDVPYALKTYFKYNTAVKHEYRSAYNATTWRTMLQDQLNKSQPVYYSGQGPAGGHAFVCDGYQDADYYHFNWGWGGAANGYYSIDNLNPSGMTFNDYQAVVRDIIPKTIDLILTNPIEDIQTEETSYQITLGDHFTSVSGDAISYAIDPSSSINGLQYSIVGGVLTLNKLEDGISHIVLTSSTRNDNNFDDFYIQFGQNSLTAGFGKSYDFSSAAYLDAGNSTEANSMQKLSFSSWIKLNSVNREHGIASKAISSSSGWYLMVQNNNIIKFSVKTQDGITRRIYSLSSLQADKWYHIDAVYDGKDLFLYINGELDNSKTTYTAVSAMANDSDRNIMLGNAYGLYMDGQIDEAVLWNDAISLEQIREIMGKTPDVSMPGLLSYWPLNEGFYAASEDVAGLHDGTFINNDLSYWKESEAPLYFFMDWNSVLVSKLLGSPSASAVYSLTQTPTLGSFDITGPATGDFSYTPSPDTSGLEEIKYSITFSKGTTPEKTVYISIKETTGIDDGSVPRTVTLEQNYPNPFNPSTMISFTLKETSEVRLSIFNISGQKVSEVAKGIFNAGVHKVDFDGSGLNSGVYYYTLEADGSSMTRKMLLIK
mgnify:CR=1 FL=1